jgi:hypothetical protein
MLHLLTTLRNLLVALLLAPGALNAQPRLTVPRVERPPTLEDFLTGRPREAEAVAEAFAQREPGDGAAASQPTFAYLSYDAAHLYVVFVCGDREPSRLRARLAPREAIAADDQVGVLLDTFHDRRRAYLLSVNPLGIQADALVTEGQPDDFSFDAVWRSAGRLTPDGFIVWMAIPFKSLRVPPGSRQEWGFALVRHIPRNSEQSYWPPITRRVEGLVQQFATLDGLADVAPGRNAQVIPYGTLAAASLRDESGALAGDVEPRSGLDAKLVVRDAVTVNVAINPDFSQVESDQPQVTTNQRFEVFFPEKRPFFIENAGVFLYGAVPAVRNVPETLFFSRRIADPGIGARVTGKAGGWAFGALAIDDRAGDDAAIAVGRLQREVAAQSSFGAFVSSRRTAGRDNDVAAFDARVKLGDHWVVTALAAASGVSEPGRPRVAGAAVNLNVNRTSRRVLYNLFYSDRSPSFRADLGFVPRTDIRQIEQYTEYRWRPARGPVVAVGPNSYFRLNWNRQGRLQEWIVRYPFQIDLKGRTSIFVRRVESAEIFRGITFREHLQTLNVTTEWLKWLAIAESIEGGRTVNFFPPPGGAPSPASFLTASLSLSVRVVPQLRVDATWLVSELREIAGGAHEARAPAIFTNHIGRVATNYQFTRPLSVRAILDYRAVLPNPSRVSLARDKRLTADLLFTYLVQPGTAMYVGYTTGFDNMSMPGPPTEVRSRQLFVKVSYLLRI